MTPTEMSNFLGSQQGIQVKNPRNIEGSRVRDQVWEGQHCGRILYVYKPGLGWWVSGSGGGLGGLGCRLGFRG